MRLPRRTAIVCFLALLSWSLVGACRPATPVDGGREALAAAVGDTLPLGGRLSGGFRPSARIATRAAANAAPALSPDVRIAIAQLEKRATAEDTPSALADVGVAYLVQGDIDRAITTLEDATAQEALPPAFSDLSAAYLARAERTESRRIESLARALEAAERSLKLSRSNEALFNRAFALDGLAPYTGTPAPWAEYAGAERDAAWRDAATRESANDRPVDDARDRWDTRQRDLREKLQGLDAAFVTDTVRLYPEASFEIFERELLADPRLRPQAQLVASALYEVTRDPMARDEVAAQSRGGDALVRAHLAFVQGLKQYSANDLAGARRSFVAALDGFTRTAAPYRLCAAMQVASIDWREGRLAEAQATLAMVERDTRARGYTTLLARALSQRGLVYQRQWRLGESLAALRESAQRFEAANQRESVVAVYQSLSDALRTLGETHESWAYVGRTLEALPQVRRPIRRYLSLYNASLFASRHGLNEAALLFQDATVRAAADASDDVLTEAIIQRALVHIRRGDQARAMVDFNAATQRVAALGEGAFKAYAGAEIEIVRAQLADADDAALTGLERAISFFEQHEPGRVPGLYLLLARTPAARASRALAERALQSGIATLERQHASVGDEALQISYFDDSWALFQDMVALQADARDMARAFEFAERARARSLLATAQGASLSRTRRLDDITESLPAAVLLVQYATLADRVLIWTIARGQAAVAEQRIAEQDLARLISRHRSAIQEGRDDAAVNDRLFELLLHPVVKAASADAVVVLVPDGQLQQLPFATLRNPATRRYLIEEHPLMLTPSASFFLDAQRVPRPAASFSSALLVGNPAASGARKLPGAEAEVEAAAQLYARHEILTGPRATKARFLDAAPAFSVVHFGGHAFINPEFPLLSRLVFADEGGVEQSLFAHELSRLRFPNTRVVMLAACSTAAGAVSRGEGVVSITRPFLGAGVQTVISSQWDVDDRATEQLTMAFHHELVRSRNPVDALRAAQLHMLRSGDAAQALPRNWGAFVAVGSTGS